VRGAAVARGLVPTGPGGVGHRDFAASGVAKGPGRHPEAAPKGLDEVRGLAVAHQPCDVGHCQRLMGEEFGGVAQPHRAQMGGEGGRADLVVGAFELARRDRQGLSERREGQWPAVPALDGHLRVDVDLGHELDGGLAMGGGTRAVLPGHVVVSDKIAPIGTSGADEHRRRGKPNDLQRSLASHASARWLEAAVGRGFANATTPPRIASDLKPTAGSGR
jgi:hypothetical protein